MKLNITEPKEVKGAYIRGLKQRVLEQGYDCGNTIEILDFRDYLENIKERAKCDDWWTDHIGADISMMESIFFAGLRNDSNVKIKNYDSKFYSFIHDEIPRVAWFFKGDNIETRRAVIRFPENHCFTSIQLLVRSDKMPEGCLEYNLYVHVNMRSCNLIDNLGNDLYLSYRIAMQVISFAETFLKKKINIKTTSMSITIGSLHIIQK